MIFRSKSPSGSPSLPDYQFTPAQLRYLEVLQCAEHDWSISRLCIEAGIHRASYYRWQREPGFAYQLARMAVRHISVSAPVFFARAMNSALEGGRPVVWNAMFRFLTTPKAMDALQANLAALAQLAADEGATNTKKWDANQEKGPHHRAALREQLQTVGRSLDPAELRDYYEPAAQASREKLAPEVSRPVVSARPAASENPPSSHPLAGIPPVPAPAPVANKPADQAVSSQAVYHPFRRYYRSLLSHSSRRYARMVLAGARLQSRLLPGQRLILA